ncbi:SusC/RagA family TonB-linked outer membrane protein [Christiangramia echinicola]|uniref:TonB-linked outer membrane protein, SusC/RagA family n=1 Tax=Christiangramia echinicola TaxID=279359 RepID=A0A1H1MLH0_9FLAO|nr:TonB-dependent receptor [Christiangramia echinicola]SDR87671.1 TonB-linked outer membrane protein, SusC/RagA family [Christiangramia echinicola]
MRLKKLLRQSILLCMVLVSGIIYAQTEISGKVVDKNGIPLPGATVSIKNTSIGVITDFDGNFTLTAPEGTSAITVSFLGYKTIQKPISDDLSTIIMSQDQSQLDEVVVVGYGTVKKSDLVGSVSSVEVDEATAVPTTNVSEMIRGRAAGVQVNLNDARPGGNSNILVRGKVSLVGNDPLIIVDGVPYDNINDVAPDDIVSLEILKDASSQAIYGSRAANGVILITTKRGSKGKFQVNYHGYTTTQKLTKNFDIFSGPEYAQVRREAFRTDNEGEYLDDATIFEPFELEAIANENYVDWEDLVIRDATIMSHTVSASGGGEKTKVYTSLNYFDQSGIIPTSGFKRGTFRLNLDQQITDKLSVQANVNIQKSEQNIETGNLDVINISPLAKPFDENGDLIREPLGEGRLTVNPLWNIREADNDVFTNLRDLNLVGLYQFNPNLSYKLNAFSRVRDGSQGIYRSTTHPSADGDIRGLATLGNTNYEEFLIENIVDYSPQIGENHSLDFTGVHAVNQRKTTETSVTKSGFANDNLGYNGKADLIRGTTRDVTRRRLVSFMGRGRYGYLDRYLLTLTLRADGSSVFAENEKFGYFPAAAFAWKAHEEAFLQDSKIFDQLKFRVSYGATGNDGINPSESLGVADDLPYVFGGNTVGGFAPLNRLPNPALKWETTTTLNAGVDFRLLDNLFNGTVEYYSASTTDFLLDRVLSGVSGFNVTRFNIGEVQNRGVEATLNTNIINKDNLQWSIGMIWSANENEVVSLAGERDQEGNLIDFESQGLFIGESIDNIYQFVFDGIWQEGDDIENSAQPDARVGEVKVKDLDGDGDIDDDDRIIIDQNPDWYGSITTNLRYKGFELFADFYIVEGATKINPYLADGNLGAAYQGGANSLAVDYYLPENPSNQYIRPSTTTPSFLRALAVDDASYMRLRTITLGYNFSRNLLDNVGLDKARLYVTGTNLVTITDYKSYSPENNPGQFPDAKGLTLGIQLGL